ncbi:subtilisin-like protein [Paramyrothecium foliicola]|nr:subtilisin-like protein [Paramyrothecium foliicola]
MDQSAFEDFMPRDPNYKVIDLQGLRRVIQKVENTSLDLNVDLSTIIIEVKPYLAFETYQHGREGDIFGGRCRRPSAHKKGKDRNTPFQLAAESAITRPSKKMMSEGKRFFDSEEPSMVHLRRELQRHSRAYSFSFLQYLRFVDPSNSDCELALQLAIGAENGSIETLRELLSIDGFATYAEPGGTSPGNQAFIQALDNGLVMIVEEFLMHQKLIQEVVSSDNIIRATSTMMGREGTKKADDSTIMNRLRIAKMLVAAIARQGVITSRVADTLIKGDFIDIWYEIEKKADFIDSELASGLLHLAVFYQKKDFVKLFADKYGNSVSERRTVDGNGLAKQETRKTNKQFPLWYNNHQWDPTRMEFDEWKGDAASEEVRKDVRNILVTKAIEVAGSELSDILHESKVGELCFDLSQVNSAIFSISNLVDSWTSQRSNQKLLKYEKTLRYVEFPPLDLMEADRDTPKGNSHFQSKHTEVFRILDWLAKRDVDTIIKLKVPDRLVNPHDAIGMAERVGAFKVKKLDWRVLDLPLSVFKDDAKDRIDELHLYASGNRAVVSHWLSQEGITSFKNLKTLDIKIIKETSSPETARILKNDIRIGLARLYPLKEYRLGINPENVTIAPWYPSPKPADLSEIASRISPELAQWLKKLESHVKDLPATPRFEPTKAIEWAISKRVDVISMSFVIGENDPSVSWMVENATRHGIVMVCSTHDEGSRFRTAWPAAYAINDDRNDRSIITLAACDEYGKLLRNLREDEYRYMICGQDVTAGVIPFLDSEPTVTGSSASTALAAGLSSLILTCDRLAHPDRSYGSGIGKGSRYDKIRGYLDQMQSTGNSKFVLMGKFGRLNEPLIGQATSEKRHTGPSVRTVLEDSFEMR